MLSKYPTSCRLVVGSTIDMDHASATTHAITFYLGWNFNLVFVSLTFTIAAPKIELKWLHFLLIIIIFLRGENVKVFCRWNENERDCCDKNSRCNFSRRAKNHVVEVIGIFIIRL